MTERWLDAYVKWRAKTEPHKDDLAPAYEAFKAGWEAAEKDDDEEMSVRPMTGAEVGEYKNEFSIQVRDVSTKALRMETHWMSLIDLLDVLAVTKAMAEERRQMGR